jgi:hypothetical protein
MQIDNSPPPVFLPPEFPHQLDLTESPNLIDSGERKGKSIYMSVKDE